MKPGARIAARTTRNNKIGIIGTQATINSKIYNEFINEISPNALVVGKACPLFVPLIEEGLIDDSVTREMASRYLSDFKEKNIDTLILGCTHYPLLQKTIAETMGEDVILVNPAYETAKELSRMIKENGIETLRIQSEKNNMYELYVSDTAEKFKDFAKTILPFEVETIKQINIEDY